MSKSIKKENYLDILGHLRETFHRKKSQLLQDKHLVTPVIKKFLIEIHTRLLLQSSYYSLIWFNLKFFITK